MGKKVWLEKKKKICIQWKRMRFRKEPITLVKGPQINTTSREGSRPSLLSYCDNGADSSEHQRDSSTHHHPTHFDNIPCKMDVLCSVLGRQAGLKSTLHIPVFISTEHDTCRCLCWLRKREKQGNRLQKQKCLPQNHMSSTWSQSKRYLWLHHNKWGETWES